MVGMACVMPARLVPVMTNCFNSPPGYTHIACSGYDTSELSPFSEAVPPLVGLVALCTTAVVHAPMGRALGLLQLGTSSQSSVRRRRQRLPYLPQVRSKLLGLLREISESIGLCKLQVLSTLLITL